MTSVAFLDVNLYKSETDNVLLKNHYLSKYQLIMDENENLRIRTIFFFWECVPPEIDEAYAIKEKD